MGQVIAKACTSHCVQSASDRDGCEASRHGVFTLGTAWSLNVTFPLGARETGWRHRQCKPSHLALWKVRNCCTVFLRQCCGFKHSCDATTYSRIKIAGLHQSVVHLNNPLLLKPLEKQLHLILAQKKVNIHVKNCQRLRCEDGVHYCAYVFPGFMSWFVQWKSNSVTCRTKKLFFKLTLRLLTAFPTNALCNSLGSSC